MLQSWRDVVAEDWSSIILGSQGETELTEDDMWKQVIDKSDSTQISPKVFTIVDNWSDKHLLEARKILNSTGLIKIPRGMLY